MNLLTSLKWFESKCLSTDSAKSSALSAVLLATLSSWLSVGQSRWPYGLRTFLMSLQDWLASVSKLIELQNFSQLACVSTLSSSLACFYNWLMRVFTAGSLFCEYCLLDLCFSLISAIVSSEMGLLSDSTLLHFRMALSTADCRYDKVRGT